MSNRLDNTQALKNEQFGCEIEFSHMSQSRAVDILCNYFNVTRTANVTRGNHLNEYKVQDSNGRKWSIVTDASIHGIGCELVTPVLKYQDIETLQEVVRLFRSNGAVSNPDVGCGIHIHVDYQGHTPNSLRILQNIVYSHQQLLIDAIDMARDRYHGGYASLTNTDWLDALNKHKPQDITTFKRLWYGYNAGNNSIVSEYEADRRSNNHYDSSRYHFINFHAIWQHNTIEFRLFQFNKNIHAGELKAYIQLCMALNSYSKLVSRAPATAINVTNKKFAMRSWLINLGLIGDEFKTCRKMLTKRLPGDTAYKGGRPHDNDDLDDSYIDSITID